MNFRIKGVPKKEMRNGILKGFAGFYLVVGAIVTVFGLTQGTGDAWSTSESVVVDCSGNGLASFTNNEPIGNQWRMNVTVGGTLQVVSSGNTAYWDLVGEKEGNKIVFLLSWTDGHYGTDSRSVTIHLPSGCSTTTTTKATTTTTTAPISTTTTTVPSTTTTTSTSTTSQPTTTTITAVTTSVPQTTTTNPATTSTMPRTTSTTQVTTTVPQTTTTEVSSSTTSPTSSVSSTTIAVGGCSEADPCTEEFTTTTRPTAVPLPTTGSDSGGLVVLGCGLLVAGLGLVVASRRNNV